MIFTMMQFEHAEQANRAGELFEKPVRGYKIMVLCSEMSRGHQADSPLPVMNYHL